MNSLAFRFHNLSFQVVVLQAKFYSILPSSNASFFSESQLVSYSSHTHSSEVPTRPHTIMSWKSTLVYLCPSMGRGGRLVSSKLLRICGGGNEMGDRYILDKVGTGVGDKL